MNPIFGATIKVIAGFYLGCTGHLVDRYNAYVDRYVVNLTCAYKNSTEVEYPRGVVIDLKDMEILDQPRSKK